MSNFAAVMAEEKAKSAAQEAAQEARLELISTADGKRGLSKLQRAILLLALEHGGVTSTRIKIGCFKLQTWWEIPDCMPLYDGHCFKTTAATRAASVSISRAVKSLRNRELIRHYYQMELTGLGLRVAQAIKDSNC